MLSNYYCCGIELKINFLNKISKNTQVKSSLKIRPVGADLLHAEWQTDGRIDRRTDMTELIFAFRNSVNAPNDIATIERSTYN
jgi:hypothetical protein